MFEIECPSCGKEFYATEWEDGECPECKNKYTWDEMCTEDYSDCWTFPDWENKTNA